MNPGQYRILIRGGGELASAVAHHLHGAGFTKILLLERQFPKAVRRQVCFSEAVLDGKSTVDGVTAELITSFDQVEEKHTVGSIAVMVGSLEPALENWKPDVFIEGTMLRQNWGLTKNMAPVVIALGPGYVAGKDCHAVVDTARGPEVGAVHEDTGEHLEVRPPATIMGFTDERALKAARDGIFFTHHEIGDEVERGERIGTVVSIFGVEDIRRGVPVDATYSVTARISGVIRGLLRDGAPVKKNDRIGDVDPRGQTEDLTHLSDKSRRVAEGVHEALIDLVNPLPTNTSSKA
ncbi:MAG: EF2563 family selenium-dependent molybdenum hydroxylase system protein [Thermoanaerobaculales bacterium]|nr:EF2563 family selenium-dependent molybdenum hydroxylase system protein [Thermoanaerobaculales bacterium]